MPIYEYKCKECGSKFEVLVYSNTANIVCEKCGSENSEKLMSGFASTGTSVNLSSSCSANSKFT